MSLYDFQGRAPGPVVVARRIRPGVGFTFFGGGSLSYLILQLSLEVGWSRALDPELPLVPQGTAFPSNKAYFGSLGLRVTF